MNPIITKFEFLTDVVEQIDNLIEKSKTTIDKHQKKEILNKARELAIAYEDHVGRKIFNQIV